jgi:hypothetical protein
LNSTAPVPSHEAIRGWMQRVGLGRVRLAKKADGGTWLVDHTNQIGQEKVLTVLRVGSAPSDGDALRHQDVEVLATIPGTKSKREDVAREYEKIAATFGRPDNVVTDGAVELRESVQVLEKAGNTPRIFRDPKHFLANKLEALLKKDADYEAFSKQIGPARSALQQTELAHFTPPPFKTKARFMNLQPTIVWAAAVLWHLNHPDSASRRNVSRERLEEQLGWLRGFADSLARWQSCQAVIAATLTFLNQRGLFVGVVAAYQPVVTDIATCPASQQLVTDMTSLLGDYEQQLQPGERVPISTEILESSFALYKQLEQQHSKCGFTNLLLTFSTLLRKTTAAEVTTCFAAVKVADIKSWTKEHFPNTLTSQRHRMYREAKPKPTPKNRATPLSNAA